MNKSPKLKQLNSNWSNYTLKQRKPLNEAYLGLFEDIFVI